MSWLRSFAQPRRRGSTDDTAKVWMRLQVRLLEQRLSRILGLQDDNGNSNPSRD